jgi:hypothetical protein
MNICVFLRTLENARHLFIIKSFTSRGWFTSWHSAEGCKNLWICIIFSKQLFLLCFLMKLQNETEIYNNTSRLALHMSSTLSHNLYPLNLRPTSRYLDVLRKPTEIICQDNWYQAEIWIRHQVWRYIILLCVASTAECNELSVSNYSKLHILVISLNPHAGQGYVAYTNLNHVLNAFSMLNEEKRIRVA